MNAIHNNHDMLIIEISLSSFSIGASNALRFWGRRDCASWATSKVPRLVHFVRLHDWCQRVSSEAGASQLFTFRAATRLLQIE
jgi:hypothetical protein